MPILGIGVDVSIFKLSAPVNLLDNSLDKFEDVSMRINLESSDSIDPRSRSPSNFSTSLLASGGTSSCPEDDDELPSLAPAAFVIAVAVIEAGGTPLAAFKFSFAGGLSAARVIFFRQG